MPVCPSCNTEHNRRAQGGVCPTCGIEIVLHNGVWFATDGENPVSVFIRQYEKFYSLWLTKGQFENRWRIPKSKIGRESAQAKRIIHEICDGDLTLALKALEILFTDSRWKWRNYSTLLFIINDIYTAKVLAYDALERKRQHMEKEKKAINYTEWRQELFDL